MQEYKVIKLYCPIKIILLIHVFVNIASEPAHQFERGTGPRNFSQRLLGLIGGRVPVTIPETIAGHISAPVPFPFLKWRGRGRASENRHTFAYQIQLIIILNETTDTKIHLYMERSRYVSFPSVFSAFRLDVGELPADLEA